MKQLFCRAANGLNYDRCRPHLMNSDGRFGRDFFVHVYNGDDSATFTFFYSLWDHAHMIGPDIHVFNGSEWVPITLADLGLLRIKYLPPVRPRISLFARLRRWAGLA